MPLDQRVFVVGPPEVDQGEAQFLDRPEGADPEQVLLERPDETLGAAVAFGRPDEGRRRRGSEPCDLFLEIAEHVLASVIVADAQARGRALLDAAEAFDHALPDRLQRLMAGAVERGVDADAFGRALVDGDEDGDLAVLEGEGGGHICSPHGIDGFGDDRAVMVARTARSTQAGRGLKAVLSHQAAHALLRGTQTRVTQPRPDLPIPLAMEGAARERLPDGLDQRGVGHRSLRPRPAPWHRWHRGRAPGPIDPRPGDASDAADPGDTVAAARGDRDDGAHRFDLRAAKGLPASSRSIFA